MSFLFSSITFVKCLKQIWIYVLYKIISIIIFSIDLDKNCGETQDFLLATVHNYAVMIECGMWLDMLIQHTFK